MRDFLPSFLIAFIAIGVILAWELSPPESGTVIAVLAPGVSLKTAVNSTDAFFVGESEIPGGYVLYSNQPGFPERLRNAGAMLVLDAAYDAACLSTDGVEQQSRWADSSTIK